MMGRITGKKGRRVLAHVALFWKNFQSQQKGRSKKSQKGAWTDLAVVDGKSHVVPSGRWEGPPPSDV
jgi:hypothetical protein